MNYQSINQSRIEFRAKEHPAQHFGNFHVKITTYSPLNSVRRSAKAFSSVRTEFFLFSHPSQSNRSLFWIQHFAMPVEGKARPYSPEYFGFVQPRSTEVSKKDPTEPDPWDHFEVPTKAAVQAQILELRKAQLKEKYFK